LETKTAEQGKTHTLISQNDDFRVATTEKHY